jgi:hypothetical protein
LVVLETGGYMFPLGKRAASPEVKMNVGYVKAQVLV